MFCRFDGWWNAGRRRAASGPLAVGACNQRLFRVARGVCDDGDAEDIVQEAYAHAFEDFPRSAARRHG